MVSTMKLLPSKGFILMPLLILLIGAGVGFGIYYYNNYYQKFETPFAKGPVTLPPKTLRLDLTQPQDDILSFQSSIEITGKTTPLTDVLISTETKDTLLKSEADGSFAAVLNLLEGVNIITTVVFDETGDNRSVEKTVYYSKEKI